MLAVYNASLPEGVDPNVDTGALRDAMHAVAFSHEPRAVRYRNHVVQSYNLRNGKRRDRCIRCKGLFELKWVGNELPEATYPKAFFVPGTCAEYITFAGIATGES